MPFPLKNLSQNKITPTLMVTRIESMRNRKIKELQLWILEKALSQQVLI